MKFGIALADAMRLCPGSADEGHQQIEKLQEM